MNLDQHLLKNMFEKSLFSDLSLSFFHESFPFIMRFDVHKAVVAQSPFFRLLLENTYRLTIVDPATSTDNHLTNSQQSTTSPSHVTNGALYLTIDLIEAMTRRGFNMTPSQHIIRRQWQKQTGPMNEKTTSESTSSSEYKTGDDGTQQQQTRHILGSHLRFALKWMYSMERTSMVDTLQDEDTLRVLCVGVLFGLDTLVDDCLERYTTHQLSIDAITNDLETICQLPRDHKAYQQLRDAALLLLLRLGPQHPRHLARLPVDYMSDILSVDLLYIGCEYERYCLLREVLVAYMQSVGKITWTPTGPVDQDFKRLSGFVQNPILQQRHQHQEHSLSATDVRSSKRKRIPSEELDFGGGADKDTTTTKHQRLARLSFSACVPFEKLVADASSGGVIDKATVLSYLLRTTVNYSNMTFDQLAIVRQDGIVDESIVFRALWQREELERLLFPFNYQQNQQISDGKTAHKTTTTTIIPRFGKMGSKNNSSGGGGGALDAMDRRAALDEYFDVGDTDGKGKRRRMLLGTPRFRFCASIPLVLPGTVGDGEDNGWDFVKETINSGNASTQHTQHTGTTTTTDDDDPSDIFDDDDNNNLDNDDDDDDNDSIWVCEDEKESLDGKHTKTTEIGDSQSKDLNVIERLTIGDTAAKTTECGDSGVGGGKNVDSGKQKTLQRWIYKKTVYSEPECVLGHWHRVRLEVQLLPRSMVSNPMEGESTGSGKNKDMKCEEENSVEEDDKVLLCRFELQRDCLATKMTGPHQRTDHLSNTASASSSPSSQKNMNQRTFSKPDGRHLDSSRSTSQQTKIRYDIYCLNQHQILDNDDRVDPEDRVLVPVSKVTEADDAMERASSYVKQVALNMDALDENKQIEVDMVVALEIFGFQKI